MKHCHFSILWNEIAFLKQKLPFLYKHFDQLIFYDLNIRSSTFSNDGGHEYIKNFPDPEKKITLIEKTNLKDVNRYHGSGCIEKQQMFAVGSQYVKSDMDVFWCTDMDEFFKKSLIAKVENLFNTTGYIDILVPQLIFFKNENYVYAIREDHCDHCKRRGRVVHQPTVGHRYQPEVGNAKLRPVRNDYIWLPWSRIMNTKVYQKGILTRVPNRIYPHCDVTKMSGEINSEVIFHFGVVGRERVALKLEHRGDIRFLNTFDSFCQTDLDLKLKDGQVDYVGKVHGDNHHYGLKINDISLPRYIDVDQMMRDLGAPR